MKPQVDYSLYLVTDSTDAILGSRDLVEVVEQALRGGVTIVQYRDKTSDTGALISTGLKLHAVCRKYNIPLLINDRVDVALAVGCEGVHVGQDDMKVSAARQLLGPDKIIGATVSSVEEARIAVDQGADYLGIGTLYATATKKNTKDIIGITGIRAILAALDTAADGAARNVKTVCIGGVNASNLQRVVYKLLAPSPDQQSPKTIDGVAVVSAIIGAPDPESASSHLLNLFKTPPPWTAGSTAPFFTLHNPADEIAHVLGVAATCTAAVRAASPLSHNMTNLVVQNFAANVALAIGASPIMANYGLEAGDLAKLGGALVVNMGTVTPDGLANYLQAIDAYNAVGGPIVLDPVGAGATQVRRDALKQLLGRGYFDLIKGNEAEIVQVGLTSGLAPRSPTTQQKGVDSSSALSLPDRAALASRLAARERCVVLLTGATDVLSDGARTFLVKNGHAVLGSVTGTGCTLGTTLSAYLAANRGDTLLAALAGVLHFEIAAERAVKARVGGSEGVNVVRGPGSFVPAFLDELYLFDRKGGWSVDWAKEARVESWRGKEREDKE